MNDVAIHAEELSKRYRIGTWQRYPTLRNAVSAAITSPLKRAYELVRGNGAAGNLHETIWALRDVSFSVRHGDVLGIIGRNGAGKSTVLKILSRITEPTAGHIVINGRVAALLEVGTGFHAELTGRENIYLNGAILGMGRREINRKFDEIVAFAEVEKFIDTPVKHYSSGMGLRLGFAVAAHLEPEILIVDEVLAVGDAEFQKKCLGKMESASRQGRTVLFVSHNLAAITSLTTNAIWLEKGHIRKIGATPAVVSEYLEQFDRALTGYVEFGQSESNPSSIRSIEVLQNGVTVSSVRMGTPITFRVRFEAKSPVHNPQLALGIDSVDKGRLVSLSTRLVGYNSLPGSVHSGVFTCHVETLLLNQGTYFVSISLADGNTEVQQIEHACKFHVLVDDVFGTGRVLQPRQGVIYLPHVFKFHDS